MASQTEALRERADALLYEARTISALADPDDVERARFDEIEVELEAIKERRERLESLEAVARTANVLPATPTILERVDESSSMRDRALGALERHRVPTANGDRLDGLLRNRDIDGSAAEWVVAASHPDYVSAFETLVAHPRDGHLRLSDAERAAYSRANNTRAAMTLTGANGGYLVPFTLDPSVVLTNDGVADPMRKIARIETITTDDWNGVTSAGVTAEWLAEATEAADASPTFTQPTITANKASAYLQASLEVTADSNISEQIGGLIADAKTRLEGAAFWTGTGTNQPTGIVTSLALVTASRVAGSSGAAGAADLVAADIFAVDNALPSRHTPNASWIANKTTYNAIRRLANVNAGNNPSSFWADFGAGMPSTLLGYPVYRASEVDSTIVSGSNDDVIVLGDFSKYVIVDRVGMSIAFNPMIMGANRRPTGEVGFFAYWRVGGKTIDTNAHRMLRV